MSGLKATPGPWPYEYTGDGKRIVIGKGLVEGPHGYEVAEVYSDDCDQAEAEANARLIAAAPEMFDALSKLRNVLHDGILNSGGADVAAALKAMVAALAKARGEGSPA